MNYNKIRKIDISNGPGVRVSIFVQGCVFNCKNCFNPETHNFNGGKKFTFMEMNKLLDLCGNSYIEGLSILGGEPLHPKNVNQVVDITKQFKKKYPLKTLWIWTGYKYETLIDWVDLSNVDVLVDGQFQEELHDPTLLYKGSSNQRVIDVQKTLQNKDNGVILYSK